MVFNDFLALKVTENRAYKLSLFVAYHEIDKKEYRHTDDETMNNFIAKEIKTVNLNRNLPVKVQDLLLSTQPVTEALLRLDSRKTHLTDKFNTFM